MTVWTRDVDPNANPNPNAPDARDFPDCESGYIGIMICLTANPDARKISRVRILDLLFLLVLLSNCLLALFGYCTSRQDHLSVWLSTDSKASFRGIVDARPMRIPCVNLMSTSHFLFKKQILRIGPDKKESRVFI